MFDENNGKLVLVADYLKVPDALVALDYGISIHAVKLKKVNDRYTVVQQVGNAPIVRAALIAQIWLGQSGYYSMYSENEGREAGLFIE